MTLLFCDGFDHYSVNDMLSKWDSLYDLPEILMSTTYARGGIGKSLRFYYNGTPYVQKNFNEKDTIIFGTAIYLTNTYKYSGVELGIFFKNSNGNQCVLTIESDGSIAIRTSSSTGTIIAQSDPCVTAGSWKYLEIKLTVGNTGSIEVRLDSVVVINESDIDTQYQSTSGVTGIRIGSCCYGYQCYTYYDDLYICDTEGTKNNDFLGDITIYTLYPDADGTHTDFTPSTGTDHYALVNEDQMDTSDYNETDAPGDIDTFSMASASSDGAILAVQVTNMAFNSGDGGGVNAAAVCRSGTTPTDNVGETVAVSTSLTFVSEIWEQEPTDSVDWTAGKINSAEFGIKMVS